MNVFHRPARARTHKAIFRLMNIQPKVIRQPTTHVQNYLQNIQNANYTARASHWLLRFSVTDEASRSGLGCKRCQLQRTCSLWCHNIHTDHTQTLEADQGKGGWTALQKIVKSWT